MYARYEVFPIITQVGDKDGFIAFEKRHRLVERSQNEWHHVLGQRVPYGKGEGREPKNWASESEVVQKHQNRQGKVGLECWIENSNCSSGKWITPLTPLCKFTT